MILPNCYFNNQICAHESVAISPSNLAIHRGYGVFDYFTFHNGKNDYLDWYLDRFYRSIKKANISINITRSDIKGICEDLHRLNETALSNIKLIATGGDSKNGYTPEGPATFLILNYAHKWNPKELYSDGSHLISFEYQRPFADIKSINYFNSYLLKEKIETYKAADVLYYNNGIISETSRANVFMVKDGILSTPKSNILPGITRKIILETNDRIHCLEKDIQLPELLSADEVFITSTTKYVMPIVSIDGQSISNGQPGPISGKLSKWMMTLFA